MNREIESLKQRLDHDQARRNDLANSISARMEEMPALLTNASPASTSDTAALARTHQIVRLMAMLAVDQQTYMTLSNRINETQLEILSITMREALKVMVRP